MRIKKFPNDAAAEKVALTEEVEVGRYGREEEAKEVDRDMEEDEQTESEVSDEIQIDSVG
jgi:hypothetical protein